MTQLSVNINKIALIRNSRGRNFPDVVAFSEQFFKTSVRMVLLCIRVLTSVMRATRMRTNSKALCDKHGKELNIEGNPTTEFLNVVKAVRPA